MERLVNRPLLCPMIIGRTPEFAALRSLVEQAKEGQGHIALIAGEAGIGKSRLVSELKTTAVARGFLVVQGACFPTDLTYPYAPLLDLLRSLVASNPKASLTAAVETLARDIFPLLPELVPDHAARQRSFSTCQHSRRCFSSLRMCTGATTRAWTSSTIWRGALRLILSCSWSRTAMRRCSQS